MLASGYRHFAAEMSHIVKLIRRPAILEMNSVEIEMILMKLHIYGDKSFCVSDRNRISIDNMWKHELMIFPLVR